MTNEVRLIEDEEFARFTDGSVAREALVRYSERRTAENAAAWLDAVCQTAIIELFYGPRCDV